jgi:S1-C subfamily serine protease
MRKVIVGSPWLLLVAFLAVPTSIVAESHSALAEKISKSSIVIKVKVQEKLSEETKKENQKPKEGWFLCSGTQIEQGVLSNAHCYPDETFDILQLWVRGEDGVSHEAQVVKKDKELDLLLLSFVGHYTNAVLATNPLKVGDEVFAIGHGLGLENTFTAGVVSALNRILTGSPIKFIQHTAPINGGFSGAALYNEQGELVGVNNAIISPDWFFHSWSGISLAVPLEQILEFLK